MRELRLHFLLGASLLYIGEIAYRLYLYEYHEAWWTVVNGKHREIELYKQKRLVRWDVNWHKCLFHEFVILSRREVVTSGELCQISLGYNICIVHSTTTFKILYSLKEKSTNITCACKVYPYWLKF